MSTDPQPEHPNNTPRLAHQLERVKLLMLDGRPRTLGDVEAATGFPQASISARLRDLRKKQHGEYVVERASLGRGLYSYCIAGKVVREYSQLNLL